ncbi:MAG: SH3 domain-containing protein [Candidatus Omnitrophota bacterium]
MRAILMIIFLSGVVTAFAADAVITPEKEVPHVTWVMETPDYWIRRHPAPDQVIMTPARIKIFNKALCAKSLTDDLGAMPLILSGKSVREDIEKKLFGLKKKGFFRKDGAPVKASFYTFLDKNAAPDEVPRRVGVRPALTTAFTRQRMVPTDEPFYRLPGDIHFDQAQNSGIDPGVPLALLHESDDGEWFFVNDGISTGWVKAADVALVDEPVWRDFISPRKFVVITSARARIFKDENMWESLAAGRMGARFILKRVKGKAAEVIFPQRGDDGKARMISAFIPRADVSPDYLRYTPRTIIRQAFKLFGMPYGWGDADGGQDCSRFVNMVFATVGMALPRNSAEQGRSGLASAEFDNRFNTVEKFVSIAGRGVGGATLLRLKGHIMLYLGEVDKRLYAIHAAWAYRVPSRMGDVTRVLGRVVVSDLSLGKGAGQGALLERIVAVRFLGDKEKD